MADPFAPSPTRHVARRRRWPYNPPLPVRTIAHISDLHFGRIDPAVVEALVRELNERPPSLTVISGDFTQRGRAGQYRRAAAFLDRLPRPRLCTPGNHDIPLYNLVRRFFFPLARYRAVFEHDLPPLAGPRSQRVGA